MPIGPLAVMDETSLVLSVHVLDQTRTDLAAEGENCTAGAGGLLVERMVRQLAGGGGFGDYPASGPKHLWPELNAQFATPESADADVGELNDRLLYRQSIETARCLAERVLTSVHDANIGSIFGIGSPAWTGGALQSVASVGRECFVERSAELAARHGAGFALSPQVLAALERVTSAS